MSKKRPARKRQSSPCINGTSDENTSSRSPAPHFGANVNTIRPRHDKVPQCAQKKRIREPREYDVLYGRGGAINNHKGNINFRSLVSDKKEAYNNTNKANKTQISRDILTLIKDSKGIFLEKEHIGSTTSGKAELSGWWVEVTDAKAMSKTSQALREGAPNLRAQTEGAVTPGSENASSNEIYRSKSRRKRPNMTPRNEMESLKSKQLTNPRILKPSEDKNTSAVTEANSPPVKKLRSDKCTATNDEDRIPQGNATTIGELRAHVVIDIYNIAEHRFNSLGFDNNELHNSNFNNPFQDEEYITNTPGLHTDNNEIDRKESFKNPFQHEECYDLFTYTDHDKIDEDPILDTPIINSSIPDESLNTPNEMSSN